MSQEPRRMLVCAQCQVERIPANLMLVGGVPWCPSCVAERDERVLATRRVEREGEYQEGVLWRPPTWGTIAAHREDLGLLVLDGGEAETRDVRARRKPRKKK